MCIPSFGVRMVLRTPAKGAYSMTPDAAASFDASSDSTVLSSHEANRRKPANLRLQTELKS
jgi:hypothetical protein